MHNSTTICLLLVLGGGCGARTLVTSDAASDAAVVDGPTREGVALDIEPAICPTLKRVGSVVLDFNDRRKRFPRIVYDGSRFGVAWHSQPGVVSSSIGELRFAVIREDSTSSKDGIQIAPNDGAVPHALVATSDEYAVLHKMPKTLGHLVRRFDGKGTLQGTIAFAQQYNRVAMATHPDGYALLMADRNSPALVVASDDGQLTKPTMLITAQIMASLWVASYPGGIAAALHSTNHNATLYTLDAKGSKISGMEAVGGGLSIRSSRFVVLPSGFAAVYGSSGGRVEIEIYDRVGRSKGRTPLASSGPTIETVDDIAAVWTGRELLVVHPGPNAGQHQLRRVDADGGPIGAPIGLPKCLATATSIDAAWGGRQIAVTSMTSGSGVPSTGVCVMTMECQ